MSAALFKKGANGVSLIVHLGSYVVGHLKREQRDTHSAIERRGAKPIVCADLPESNVMSLFSGLPLVPFVRNVLQLIIKIQRAYRRLRVCSFQ